MHLSNGRVSVSSFFLEITLTLFVATVTIQLDCLACAFARSAAVLSTFLWRTRARRIFAFVLVGHVYLPAILIDFWLVGLAQLNTDRRQIGKPCRNETLSISE